MQRYFASTALLTTLAAPIFAHADISRSDQSVRILIEDTGPSGSYLEFSLADISPEANTNTLTLENPLQDYNSFGFGYLTELGDDITLAVIYDQPFGADTRYESGLPFFGGNAEITSDALTTLVHYQIDEQISIHGGLRAMQVEGSIYGSNSTLGANLFGLLEADSDPGLGFVLGGAYEIPDIAMRVSLTYNSSIDLSFEGTETAFNPATGTAVAAASNSSFDVEFPDSINLEFQTGMLTLHPTARPTI